MSRRNEYLDQGISDESADESGYDSERAEVTKTERRGVKRRKLSHSSDNSDLEDEKIGSQSSASSAPRQISPIDHAEEDDEEVEGDARGQKVDYKVKSASATIASKPGGKQKKEKKTGVIYLSSLPPYLKPSALRNLLSQRGFEPITRLFLTPASKHKHSSKKSSRQLYTEGWIEFESKKTAKRCAEALNAQLVGGKKGGFYYDDLWNMKYLKGMAWEELMAGIREERREEEGRRDEERRKIAAETKAYIEGVERGKKMDGMKKKRKQKSGAENVDDDVQRVWRQHEVAEDRKRNGRPVKKLDSQVQDVLSKII